MIIDLNDYDLIKAVAWREELHKRDSSGRFAKQVGQKPIRKGSKVVAKNGATGKVVGSTDTHYHIEKEDGKQSKVLKHNVLHADEHKELTKPKDKKATPAKPKDSSKPKPADDGIVLFHGTGVASVDKIMKNGFRANGSSDDFGNAVYFKSPVFDSLDQGDHQDWVQGRQAKGQPVPEKYLTSKGNDTLNVTKMFMKGGNQGVVMKAHIAKEHVLDCTKGRPKKLESMLKDFDTQSREGTTEAMMGFALKHILGVKKTQDMNEDELYTMFMQNTKELDKAWGSVLNVNRMSPYEVYAKKNGIGAIVDKLTTYTDEGWQIGVYDPKLIKVTDTGKGMQYSDKGVEMVKALIKAMKKARNAGYCLLHHEMTDTGLVLHIGATDDRPGDTVEKSLSDFRSFVQGWKGEEL